MHYENISKDFHDQLYPKYVEAFVTKESQQHGANAKS